MRSGVLYSANTQRKKGEINIADIVTKLKAIAWSMRWSGTGLILVSLLGLSVIYGPLMQAQVKYRFGPRPTETVSKFGSALGAFPTWGVPDNQYSIYVPKIGAISKVVANVNAADEKTYLEALKQGVAAAAGLAVPGKVGTTYLFAHSTNGSWNMARYNAVFYLLDKVETGDAIEVVYQNKLFKYQVTQKQILAADDTRYLVPQIDREILVLQTCYPPGTSWKRLIVVAKPVL